MSKKKTPEADLRTKEQLVEGAIKIFLRDGYAAASMKAIADASDCTTGKIYSNFTKKEDFLTALAEKMVEVNYRATKDLVKEDMHPMMPYLLTTALLFETCTLNEHFHELYYVGYSGKDTTVCFIQSHSKHIAPILEQEGISKTQEEIFADGFIIAGVMRSLIGCEYVGIEMSWEEKMKQFIFVSMSILGFEEVATESILEIITAHKDMIHEAAYNIIINALSGKF